MPTQWIFLFFYSVWRGDFSFAFVKEGKKKKWKERKKISFCVLEQEGKERKAVIFDKYTLKLGS